MTERVDIFGAPLDEEEQALEDEIEELYDDLGRVARSQHSPDFKERWAAAVKFHIKRLEAMRP